MNQKSRDESIRHLTYTPVKKRDGLSYDLFEGYWLDVHGPLCSRLPGLGFYVQQHFSQTLQSNLWPTHPEISELEAEYHGAVEIGFANKSAQKKFKAASKILFSDEENFIGADNAYDLPDGSKTFVDYEEDATPNGVDRYHRLQIFFSPRTTLKKLQSQLESLGTFLSTQEEIMKVRLHLPKPYDNADPQPPAPNVDHELPEERLEVGILEVSFSTALAAKGIFETAGFKKQLDALALHAKALKPFLVSHVRTFVRDGELTLAGLRGARPAELIREMGALNQTKKDVTDLFH